MALKKVKKREVLHTINIIAKPTLTPDTLDQGEQSEKKRDILGLNSSLN